MDDEDELRARFCEAALALQRLLALGRWWLGVSNAEGPVREFLHACRTLVLRRLLVRFGSLCPVNGTPWTLDWLLAGRREEPAQALSELTADSLRDLVTTPHMGLAPAMIGSAGLELSRTFGWQIFFRDEAEAVARGWRATDQATGTFLSKGSWNEDGGVLHLGTMMLRSIRGEWLLNPGDAMLLRAIYLLADAAGGALAMKSNAFFWPGCLEQLPLAGALTLSSHGLQPQGHFQVMRLEPDHAGGVVVELGPRPNSHEKLVTVRFVPEVAERLRDGLRRHFGVNGSPWSWGIADIDGPEFQRMVRDAGQSLRTLQSIYWDLSEYFGESCKGYLKETLAPLKDLCLALTPICALDGAPVELERRDYATVFHRQGQQPEDDLCAFDLNRLRRLAGVNGRKGRLDVWFQRNMREHKWIWSREDCVPWRKWTDDDTLELRSNIECRGLAPQVAFLRLFLAVVEAAARGQTGRDGHCRFVGRFGRDGLPQESAIGGDFQVVPCAIPGVHALNIRRDDRCMVWKVELISGLGADVRVTAQGPLLAATLSA